MQDASNRTVNTANYSSELQMRKRYYKAPKSVIPQMGEIARDGGRMEKRLELINLAVPIIRLLTVCNG